MKLSEQYNFASLHLACLAWCDNPAWKPWRTSHWALQKEDGWLFTIRYRGAIINALAEKLVNNDREELLEFAHLIGLDVESYRI